MKINVNTEQYTDAKNHSEHMYTVLSQYSELSCTSMLTSLYIPNTHTEPETKIIHIYTITIVLSHKCHFAVIWDFLLSHNNPCFQCNIAITNFLVSHTCEIRFHDVKGQSTVPMYSYAKILKHG